MQIATGMHLCEDGAVEAVVGGIVEAEVSVELVDSLNILIIELEVEVGHVLGQVLGAITLGDDSNTALGRPAEEDLRSGHAVLLSNGVDGLVVEEKLNTLETVHTLDLLEALGTEGGVGSDLDTLALSPLNELALSKVGVVLDLEGGDGVAVVLLEIHQGLDGEVGDTERAGETLVNEGLHGLPGLLDGGIGELELKRVGGVGPARGVADSGVDELESDGEVHDEEIEVLNTPVSEHALADGLNMLLLVVSLPELGDNEEILTLDDTLLNGAADTLTALLLVTVVCSRYVLAMMLMHVTYKRK